MGDKRQQQVPGMDTPVPSPGRLTSGESFDDDLGDNIVPSGENVTESEGNGGSVDDTNHDHGVPKDHNSKVGSFADLLMNVPGEEASVLKTQSIGNDQSVDLKRDNREYYRKLVRRLKILEKRIQSLRDKYWQSEKQNWELQQRDRESERRKRKLEKRNRKLEQRNRKLQQDLRKQKQEMEVGHEKNQCLEAQIYNIHLKNQSLEAEIFEMKEKSQCMQAKLNEINEKNEQNLSVLERIEQVFNSNESELLGQNPVRWFQLEQILRDKSQQSGPLFPGAEELGYDEPGVPSTEIIPVSTHDTDPVGDKSQVLTKNLPTLGLSHFIHGEDVHMTNVETYSGPAGPRNPNCDDSAITVISSAAPDPIIIMPTIDASMNPHAHNFQASGWSTTAGSSTATLTAVFVLIEPPACNPDEAVTVQTAPTTVATDEQPTPDQGPEANCDTVAPKEKVTGEPLTCKTCGKTFASDSTLCRHRNQMGHGKKKAEATAETRVPKKFTCPYCTHKPVQLSRRDALHRHVRDQHQTEWLEYEKNLKPRNKRVPLRKSR